ncbi:MULTISPECIES: hypothetical protein [unclassified Acinetobacter]|uniref:hypothetical protein n=1 Tax=unclassified Acinetobacter TaxID=196816 RepID=UPI0035BA6AD6
MKANTENTSSGLSQQQVQSLLATSIGFIEAYKIQTYGDVPIVLPQNVVISALNVDANTQRVEWRDGFIPAYHVNNQDATQAIALVIETDEAHKNFAMICDDMPEPMRLRISEVKDIDKECEKFVFQYVTVDGQECQIPHITNIQNHLLLKG